MKALNVGSDMQWFIDIYKSSLCVAVTKRTKYVSRASAIMESKVPSFFLLQC